jgi:hypothetical protein
MLERKYCLLCRTYQLGPCRTPDDALQCPMWYPVKEPPQGEGPSLYERTFNAAAGSQVYPVWLIAGAAGLRGAGDRLMACFRPRR